MRLTTTSLASLLLASAAALAAGGCSDRACRGTECTSALPASALEYVDPPATGWRLVRDPASSPRRLVLALVGPGGTRTRGVGLNLQGPDGVRFGTFAGGALVEDAGVLELRSVDDDPAEPVALAGGVKPGNLLSVGAYQKDRRRPAKDAGAALLRVALELDPATPPGRDRTLALAVTKAGAIPEEIGQVTDPQFLLARKLALTPLHVTVGQLVAR
jgi:hypothetical protein